MNMVKKIIALSLAVALSLTIGNVVLATDNNDNNENCKEIMLEEVTVSNDRTGRGALNQKRRNNEFRDSIEIDSKRSFKRVNKKVIVPKRDDLKKDLLMHLNKNKEKNEHNIRDIDNIVDDIIVYFENTQKNDLVAQDFRLYPHWHSWYMEPYKEKTTKHITYTNSWIGVDAYRSAAPASLTTSQTRSISYKIGISGSSEIKDFLELSGSWETTKTHSITKTAGTPSSGAPAWTVVWWRPYTRWEQDHYLGVYRTEYYNINGNLVYENRSKKMYNKRLKDNMTEFASRVNSTQNINATTPSAPTGAPNAWW
jgi:hypothetical protein